MPDTEFTIYENKALDEAGGIAGEYLDSLGVTDLAALSQEQYAEFCKRLVVGFSEHIRAAVDTGDSGVPV